MHSSDLEAIRSSAIEAMINGMLLDPRLGFFHGINGIGWVLSQTVGDIHEIEPVLTYIDKILSNTLADNPGVPLAFVEGLTGIGIYAAERARRTSNHLLLDQCLDKIKIKYRMTLAGTSPDGVDDRFQPTGMAHGIAGVCSFLAGLSNQGTKDTRNWIRQLSDWLLKHTGNYSPHGSRFPFSVPLNGHKEIYGTYLGWCYGDLGIACALYNSGIALSDSNLKTLAVGIALDCAQRGAKACVSDEAGLCHGTAGIAYLFHYLWHRTDEVAFEAARDYWVQQTLELLNAQRNVLQGSNSESMCLGAQGFLQGPVGISLILNDIFSNQLSDWKQALLLY